MFKNGEEVYMKIDCSDVQVSGYTKVCGVFGRVVPLLGRQVIVETEKLIGLEDYSYSHLATHECFLKKCGSDG